MGVNDTLHGIVGGDRRIKAVSVETLIMCLGVSVETLSIKAVSVETLTMCLRVSVETLVAKDGVGRDTNNLSRAQSKGWIRSGNDRRELSSNPTTARRTKKMVVHNSQLRSVRSTAI